MIIDRIENVRAYMGISAEMDAALTALKEIKCPDTLPARIEITEKSFINCSEGSLRGRTHSFEFHKKYIDIHVPVDTDEKIAICDTSSAPEGTPFDAERDCGFFTADEKFIVTVPMGWFCVCFPQDGHEPLLGEEGKKIKKLVYKVLA